jgi:pimeloyl-ACP methyl ester carboxylesterase
VNAGSAAANVVLVHGGFVDGSGWRAVYDLLTQDGYHVAVVQNPTLSLQGDADAARLVIDAQDGPVVLVGHSYGGAVITEAGTDQNVAALVYICAFVPDKDESVNTLLAGFPTDGPQPPILPPVNGFLFLDRDKFHDSFAGDLPAEDAAFLADSQVPWGVDALGGSVTEAAWRTKPSWYLVTTGDRMIPRQPSAPCPSGPLPRSPRSTPATQSLCRNQPRWPPSSNRPRPRWPLPSSHGIPPTQGQEGDVYAVECLGQNGFVVEGTGDDLDAVQVVEGLLGLVRVADHDAGVIASGSEVPDDPGACPAGRAGYEKR